MVSESRQTLTCPHVVWATIIKGVALGSLASEISLAFCLAHHLASVRIGRPRSGSMMNRCIRFVVHRKSNLINSMMNICIGSSVIFEAAARPGSMMNPCRRFVTHRQSNLIKAVWYIHVEDSVTYRKSSQKNLKASNQPKGARLEK